MANVMPVERERKEDAMNRRRQAKAFSKRQTLCSKFQTDGGILNVRMKAKG
jgi:hypothetical protein